MNISVTIQTDETDNLEETPAEIADGILRAVGGDENKDYVTVHIMPKPAMPGSAGTAPEPPPPPEPSSG